jgi:hypothetical protein
MTTGNVFYEITLLYVRFHLHLIMPITDTSYWNYVREHWATLLTKITMVQRYRRIKKSCTKSREALITSTRKNLFIGTLNLKIFWFHGQATWNCQTSDWVNKSAPATPVPWVEQGELVCGCHRNSMTITRKQLRNVMFSRVVASFLFSSLAKMVESTTLVTQKTPYRYR